ncbi:DUF6420 family protein [Streptomyces sp. NPDC056159]|uniref:DUF6420 family protein n=1 Tax=unclassified Streptomyces TaxID=2593676 RepID=UPI00343E7ED8
MFPDAGLAAEGHRLYAGCRHHVGDAGAVLRSFHADVARAASRASHRGRKHRGPESLIGFRPSAFSSGDRI